MITAAVFQSMNPCLRFETEPEVAATICSTWLVATAVSGTYRRITISGTEKSGPPAPEKPEPKPAAAPTEASSHLSPRPRPSRERESGFTGKST